ncbi:hypothetical protein RNN11_24665, partial [Escherichia coli]|nr:hypothetical protein [Escherichia coli]
MLSVVKPLQEFGKLDKCLSRYGTRFEFNNEKQVIFSSDVNSEDTFVILEGVISLRREENVLIGITQAPYIMGLADGLMKNDIPYKLISEGNCGNDSNLLIVFYVQIMPDDFVMQLHR